MINEKRELVAERSMSYTVAKKKEDLQSGEIRLPIMEQDASGNTRERI